MVRDTGVLGLGFNPNRHKRRKQIREDQAANRSGTGVAQSGLEQRRLAGVDSITGARVESRTGMIQI
jgi:hypothetical protein